MSFLQFLPNKLGDDLKTQVWTVFSHGGVPLGDVRWYAPWRRYSFVPVQGTVYDAACLRELADFTAAETEKQKATWK